MAKRQQRKAAEAPQVVPVETSMPEPMETPVQVFEQPTTTAQETLEAPKQALWCQHEGKYGPPFPFCVVCEKKYGHRR